MGRVSAETIRRLNEFIDSLPEEARGKCALCNQTLTHIVKQAEATIQAGTRTITRALAEKINETAAPLDRVTPEALLNRTREASGEKVRIVSNGHNSSTAQPPPPPPPPPVRLIREGVEIVSPPTPEPQVVTFDEDPDEELPQFDPTLDIDRNGNPLKPRTPEEHKREFDALAPIMIHLIEPIEAINKAPLPPANFYATIPEWLRRSLADIDKAVEYLTAIQHLHHEATK